MKNTILIWIMLLGIWGCSNDDDSSFDTSLPRENISFKAIPGGAIMYYNLAGNKEVFSVRAKYMDARGKEVVVDGTYLSDSLTLVGFDDARQNIPVQLSFFNHRMEESGGMELTFDTEDSAPAAFFKTVEVTSGWNGFQIAYDAPQSTGLAHIFYLGENPLTHEPDTLWLQTLSITKGHNVHAFSLQQERPRNTIIITTEDFRGYRVKKGVWEDIEAYAITQYPSNNISVKDPLGIIEENKTYRLGSQYLFDGKTKGEARMLEGNVDKQAYLFATKMNSVGKYWVLDLGEKQMIARLRMYAAYKWSLFIASWNWRGQLSDKYPSEVTIYGSNDMEDEESWEQLGYFYQSPLVEGWAAKSNTFITDLTVLERQEPLYADINCVANGQEYRYIKMLVNDTFHYDGQLTYQNPNKIIALSELEVFVKK